jgi:hypothetical protein
MLPFRFSSKVNFDRINDSESRPEDSVRGSSTKFSAPFTDRTETNTAASVGMSMGTVGGIADLPSAAASQPSGFLPLPQQQQQDIGRRWIVHNSMAYSQSTGILRTTLTNPQQPTITVSGRSTPAQQMLSASRSAGQLQSDPATATVTAIVAGQGAGAGPSEREYVQAARAATPNLFHHQARPTSGMNGHGVMTHNTHNEVVIDRLSMEIGSLAQQLDDSKRENDMQRREMSRLKRMMVKSANPSLPSPTQAGSSMFKKSLSKG